VFRGVGGGGLGVGLWGLFFFFWGVLGGGFVSKSIPSSFGCNSPEYFPLVKVSCAPNTRISPPKHPVESFDASLSFDQSMVPDVPTL